MDPLPPQKFQQRQWRFGRKRRRSGTEAAESEGDSKIVKKETDSTDKMDTTDTVATPAQPATAAATTTTAPVATPAANPPKIKGILKK